MTKTESLLFKPCAAVVVTRIGIEGFRTVPVAMPTPLPAEVLSVKLVLSTTVITQDPLALVLTKCPLTLTVLPLINPWAAEVVI